MKAFCLAAGHGTRLKPITDTVPKCLVPIRGKPLLGIWLDIFERYGITDVLINIHSHANIVRTFLAKQHSTVNVIVSEEEELLGSAGTLRAHRDWICEGNDRIGKNSKAIDSFWIFYADVLNAIDLNAMLAFHQRQASGSALATLGLYRVPDPKRCGVVELDTNQLIVGFEEKPQQPKSDLAFSGIMLGTPAVLDLIPPEIATPDIGFHLLPRLVGRMYGYTVREYLIDIGTMQN